MGKVVALFVFISALCPITVPPLAAPAALVAPFATVTGVLLTEELVVAVAGPPLKSFTPAQATPPTTIALPASIGNSVRRDIVPVLFFTAGAGDCAIGSGAINGEYRAPGATML